MTSNILIVSDLEENISLLTNKLKKQYSNIQSAEANFKTIGVLLKQQEIDVVLIEIIQNKENALYLCRKIKSYISFPFFVIMIVDSFDDQYKSDCILAECDDLLFRPVEDFVLFARIQSLTRLKSLNKKIITNSTNLANIDILTDLSNRRYFNIYISNLIAKAKSKRSNIVLGIIDVDYFKQINDNFGHIIGDLILNQLARVLKKT